MQINFEQIIKEILNKKFETKIHAGYDPDDVDMFFDKVINYVKEVNKLEQNVSTEISNLNKIIKENEKVLLDKDKVINALREENNLLKKEGYSNNVLAKKIAEIEEKIDKSK